MSHKPFVILFIALLALLASVSSGRSTMVHADGGDSSVIHVCRNNASGETKFVSPDKFCKKNETAIHLLPVGASGNVGIGTATPTEALDVAGNVHASGTFIAGSTTTYGDGFIALSATDLAITGGNVGIGTASPASPLTVVK